MYQLITDLRMVSFKATCLWLAEGLDSSSPKDEDLNIRVTNVIVGKYIWGSILEGLVDNRAIFMENNTHLYKIHM